MTAGEADEPGAVSRRIEAPAGELFGILADPRRHLDMDGSGMLRGAASEGVISGVGDVFVMKMHYAQLGDYEMNNHVVEYEQDRRIGWEPRPGRGYRDGGSRMRHTTRRQGDRAVARRPKGPVPPLKGPRATAEGAPCRG